MIDVHLNELLAVTALEDVNGLGSLNEEWTPTYGVNAAAARAWVIRAGRAAATVEVDPPGSGFVT